MNRRPLLTFLFVPCVTLGHEQSIEIGKLSTDVKVSSTSNPESVSLAFHFVYSAQEDLTILSRSVITSDDSIAVTILGAEFPSSSSPDGIACPSPHEITSIHEGPGSWRPIGKHFENAAGIDLRERFNNLNNILHRCDLVLFWSYRPNLGPKVQVKRLSGAITIPAHGPASAPATVVEKITKSEPVK